MKRAGLTLAPCTGAMLTHARNWKINFRQSLTFFGNGHYLSLSIFQTMRDGAVHSIEAFSPYSSTNPFDLSQFGHSRPFLSFKPLTIKTFAQTGQLNAMLLPLKSSKVPYCLLVKFSGR